ncbi:hypothetical protein IWX78_001224 [Mycetocola sp. CAN_C7]
MNHLHSEAALQVVPLWLIARTDDRVPLNRNH